jgi:hypothetical protein
LVRREPNHPWCKPTIPKTIFPAPPVSPAAIPIEAEIITAQIQETKS